jgi:hypothetical protein
MRGFRLGRTAALAQAFGLSPGDAWAKIGLKARFGDLILEGVKPGRTYSLREAARVPLGVENPGDGDMTVVVETQKPRVAAAGYENIPDPGWLKAVPETLVVGPKGVGFFDLLLTVPDDPKLVGKHFQVQVRMKGTGESMLGLAIENKVRFSVGPGPDELKEEKRRKQMQQLDFDVTPKSLTLTGVSLGRAWDSRKEARKTIRVANYAPDPLALVLAVEGWSPGAATPDGYEPIPDPSWVKVRPSTVTVGADEIGTAALVVEVPDKPENRGRKWAAVVRSGLSTGYWLDAPVRVLVETAP